MRSIILLTFIGLLACDVGSNGLDLGNPVASIQLSPSIASLREGDTLRLTAVTLDQSGQRTTPRKSPTWSTTDATHVLVDTAGLVRGLLAGPAQVQVTADSVTAVARLTVLPLPVGSIEIFVPSGVIEVGDSVQLTAIVRDIQGKRLLRSAVWSSSDTSRIRVDSTGLLRAVANGSAALTAQVDTVLGAVTVTALVPVATVLVTPDSLGLEYDDTTRLSVTLLDSTGAIAPARPLTWSIAGDPVITLSSDLLVRSNEVGRAIVTAAARHATGSAVVDVTPVEFTSISVGASHSCGLRSDGTAFCWGEGASGALGLGDTATVSRPRRISGGLVFTQLSAGDRVTCGLTPQGMAYCWGLNQWLQTGTLGGSRCGSIINVVGTNLACTLSPTAVQGAPLFTSIVAGETSSCGLTAAGAAYCWGAGGILGDSTTQSSATPVPVIGGHVFRDLAKPYNGGTCARDNTGAIFCWGLAPSPLVNGTGFDTLSGSAGSYCGLRGVDLFCWGWIPFDDFNVSVSDPRPMLPGMQFTRVAATLDHLCGIIASGETVCWGRNLNGQLGDGTLVSHFDSLGIIVADGHGFTDVEVGGLFFGYGHAHTCGLASDGRTYCWGANFRGQIGRPVGTHSTRPVITVGQP